MIINEKQLSIPPIISTSWDNILMLYLVEGQLMIHLKDHKVVPAAGLSLEVIDKIFDAHSRYLAGEKAKSSKNIDTALLKAFQGLLGASGAEGQLGLPIRFLSVPLEPSSLGSNLQHNPNQSDFPPLPQDVISKLSILSKNIPLEVVFSMPAPQSDCHCLYCQVMRAMRQGILSDTNNLPDHPALADEEMETVKDEELQFQQWDIQKLDNQLYMVTNRLDTLEQYQVYLGEPVGCTCGRQSCEHIVAVLKS